MLEVVKNPLEVMHVLAASEGKPASINLTEIIKCEEFGTRDSFLRVTAYVPDLPSFRVSDDPPFTHTGLDFAVPL